MAKGFPLCETNGIENPPLRIKALLNTFQYNKISCMIELAWFIETDILQMFGIIRTLTHLLWLQSLTVKFGGMHALGVLLTSGYY